jgi:hypothetical protein
MLYCGLAANNREPDCTSWTTVSASLVKFLSDAKKMTYEQLAKTVRIEGRKHMIGRFYCHCGEDEPFAPFTEEDAKRADEYNQRMQEFCKIKNRQSPKCSGCSADMEIFLLTS